MQFKKAFTKVANKFAKRIKQAIADENAEERAAAINELREYVKSLMPDYRWYWEKIVPEAFNCDILDEIKRLKKSMYKQSDVYFRKVNFVYRFFADDLVDECCIVSKDKVQELVDICTKIEEAAKEAGVLDESGRVHDKYYCKSNFYDLSKEEQDKERKRVEKENAAIPKDLIDLAEELLPTQEGFFFGSTEYNAYYFGDIADCKAQFTKLLEDWKDGEVVYNIMSW